jgi:hypothetical protein
MAAAFHADMLSANDTTVLSALFDPEASLSGPSPNICDDAERLPNIEASQVQALQKREAEILRPLNDMNPDKVAIEAALKSLDTLIESNPNYPSAYANRAQVRRLLLGEDREFTQKDADATRMILADLSKAISLATPASPTAPVSPLQAKVLARAHTHRAYVLHKVTKSQHREGIIEALGMGSVKAVEDMPSHDFYLGGLYGDTVARQMSVVTNPYAKLCGAIIKEAIMDDIKSSLVGH